MHGQWTTGCNSEKWVTCEVITDSLMHLRGIFKFGVCGLYLLVCCDNLQVSDMPDQKLEVILIKQTNKNSFSVFI